MKENNVVINTTATDNGYQVTGYQKPLKIEGDRNRVPYRAYEFLELRTGLGGVVSDISLWVFVPNVIKIVALASPVLIQYVLSFVVLSVVFCLVVAMQQPTYKAVAFLRLFLVILGLVV